MPTATPEQQRDLLALQRIDTRIRQLRHRRANIPEAVALAEEQETLQKVAEELADARARLDRLDKQSRRHEQEISTVESARKTEEARMYSGQIQSERQLDAIKNEIGALRRRKSDLEDSLLEIMEQTEETESLIAGLEGRQAELQQRVEALAGTVDEAATDIDAELTGAEQERAAAAARLPADLLAFYDDLRERKNGLAVAALQGRTCTGCQLELTAIELEDVKRGAPDRLSRCAQCGRVLVVGG